MRTGPVARVWKERRSGNYTGRWLAIVDFGRDEDGHRHIRQRTFGSKREARVFADEQLGAASKGSYVEPSRRTVRRFLVEDWLPSKIDLRPSTSDSYRRNINGHIIPALGDRRLQEVTPLDLNRFYREALEGGRLPHGSRRNGNMGLAPRSVRYLHGILASAFSDAATWGFITLNPASLATPPKATRPAAKSWSAGQLRQFLEHVRTDRLFSAFYVAAMTGVRRGELLGLRWCDIDWDETGDQAPALHISQTVLAVAHTIAFGTPKTARGKRRIALDPGTVSLLREHSLAQAAERLSWGPTYSDHGLVFAKSNGFPIHPEAFAKVFDRRVATSGLPRLSFHGLRHTHASILLATGANPKVTSDRLGHASVAFTLDIYSHALPDLQQGAADRAAALVMGADTLTEGPSQYG